MPSPKTDPSIPLSADELRMRQSQGNIERRSKSGNLYQSRSSIPYVDPGDHRSLEEYLAEYDRMMYLYCKSAGKQCGQKRMVLVVSTGKVRISGNEVDQQIVVAVKENSDSAASYNYPGGKLYPGEDILVGARREYTEETGLYLSNSKLIGAIAPHQEEAEEITVPWIVYIVKGDATLVYQHQLAVKPKGEKAVPCFIGLHEIGAIRSLSNIQLVASMSNNHTGDFVIESQSLGGHAISRIVTYRPAFATCPRPLKYAHLEME